MIAIIAVAILLIATVFVTIKRLTATDEKQTVAVELQDSSTEKTDREDGDDSVVVSNSYEMSAEERHPHINTDGSINEEVLKENGWYEDLTGGEIKEAPTDWGDDVYVGTDNNDIQKRIHNSQKFVAFINAARETPRDGSKIKETYYDILEPETDWSPMFVDFCFRQAGYDTKEIPEVTDFASFYSWAEESGKIISASETPSAGDVVFLAKDNDSSQIHQIGIVEAVADNLLYTIEGNYHDEIVNKTYRLEDEDILGYFVTPKE